MLNVRGASRASGIPAVYLALATWAGAASAANVGIEASRQGNAVAINARATVQAPYALIWATLTDYNHLAEFIPGMTTSQVVERRGNAATVRQTGTVDLMLFNYPLAVTVESREDPPGFIGIRALQGNLKRLEGGYRIEKSGERQDEYVLRWSGLIEPSIPVPLFITVPLMKANIANQFRGMVKEIERREAARKSQHEIR